LLEKIGSGEKDSLGVEIVVAAASNCCRETGWVTVAEGAILMAFRGV